MISTWTSWFQDDYTPGYNTTKSDSKYQWIHQVFYTHSFIFSHFTWNFSHSVNYPDFLVLKCKVMTLLMPLMPQYLFVHMISLHVGETFVRFSLNVWVSYKEIYSTHFKVYDDCIPTSGFFWFPERYWSFWNLSYHHCHKLRKVNSCHLSIMDRKYFKILKR